MKTGQMVFLFVLVLVVLVGAYLITQAAKPETVTPAAATPKEPTANIWTVIGGLIDVFSKDETPENGNDLMGPPTLEDWQAQQ